MRYWLAIVSGLVLGVGLGYVMLEPMQHGARADEYGLAFFHRHSRVLSSMLRAYSRSHGGFPTNDEGMSAVADAAKRRADHDRNHGGELMRCRVTASGVLSWWGDPIIYENHRGIRAAALDSLQQGLDRGYAHEVDDGVYLWSIGAKRASERIRAKEARRAWTMGLSLLAWAALLAAFAIRVREQADGAPQKRSPLTIGPTVLGIAISVCVAVPVMLVLSTFGCGCPGIQVTRTPALTRAYKASMRAYCDKGIISRQTYAKRIKALRLDDKDRLYHRP